jgi:PhnB protein
MMRPDGKIGHTEMKIGDSVVMLSEAMPNFPPLKSMLYIYVEDVDATFARALAAGATEIHPPEDQFYGDRSGGVTEPSGNLIWIGTHIEDVSDDEIRRRAAARGK